jgi:hypothetical protein
MPDSDLEGDLRDKVQFPSALNHLSGSQVPTSRSQWLACLCVRTQGDWRPYRQSCRTVEGMIRQESHWQLALWHHAQRQALMLQERLR